MITAIFWERLPDAEDMSSTEHESQVDLDLVHLVVFPPSEMPFSIVAAYDESGAPATWHWPEHIPPR